MMMINFNCVLIDTLDIYQDDVSHLMYDTGPSR